MTKTLASHHQKADAASERGLGGLGPRPPSSAGHVAPRRSAAFCAETGTRGLLGLKSLLICSQGLCIVSRIPDHSLYGASARFRQRSFGEPLLSPGTGPSSGVSKARGQVEPGARCRPRGSEGVAGPQRAGTQADRRAVCRGLPPGGQRVQGPSALQGLSLRHREPPRPLPALLSRPPTLSLPPRFPRVSWCSDSVPGAGNEVGETLPPSLQGPGVGGGRTGRGGRAGREPGPAGTGVGAGQRTRGSVTLRTPRLAAKPIRWSPARVCSGQGWAGGVSCPSVRKR